LGLLLPLTLMLLLGLLPLLLLLPLLPLCCSCCWRHYWPQCCRSQHLAQQEALAHVPAGGDRQAWGAYRIETMALGPSATADSSATCTYSNSSN